MTLTDLVNTLAEGLEAAGVTYEELERIDAEVRAEVEAELGEWKGADDEHNSKRDR